MIGMAMFHGDLDFCVESHRIWQMPSIRYLIWRFLLLVEDGACEWESVVLHAPSLAEIVWKKV
jgi:hypothetical protein